MEVKTSAASGGQTLLGEGWVTHSRPPQEGRSSPRPRIVENTFRYSIFNLLIPIHCEKELNKLEYGRLLSILPSDYLEGRSGSLDTNVRDFLLRELNYVCEDIWLQTLPRLLGYSFNPVSFWYCHKKGRLDSVLCEVNNTFGDRHFYFIRDISSSPRSQHVIPKTFHVSPFFKIAGHYSFEFCKTADTTDVRIRLYDGRALKLDTRIHLALRPLNEVSKFQILKRYGWMTAMVMFRIHLQALRLWFKGAEFFSRPDPPKEKVTYDHAKS